MPTFTGSTTGRDPARESGLLERERELSAARDAASAAAGGNGAVVLVEGPPGIGKSRLLDALAEVAEQTGLRPLRAAGGELERQLVFGVARELLVPLARDASGPSAAAALGAQLVRGESADGPTLVRAGSPETPVATPSPGDEAAALNGLRWLVADAAARRPLALVVDDAQWADASSLRFLAYLARRLDGLPVLLIVAARESPPGGGEPAFEQLRLAAARLTPEPLSERGAGQLLDRALGRAPADAFVRACHAATGGNPLLLHELATELRLRGVTPSADHASQVRSVGPAGVARAVVARLEGIGGGAPAVARAVAVLGRSAQPDIVADLAGCEPPAASDAVIALAWADVLVDERPLRFTHPVVRTAIYEALSQTERAGLHRRAAGLLDAAGRSRDEVVAHLLASDPARDPAVVAALREAGARAFARGAPAASVEYLRRALSEPPPPAEAPALRAMLGNAELRIGDPRAVADLQLAVAEAHDAAERAAYALALGRALVLAGRGGEAAAVLGEAADAALAGDRELGLRLAAEAMFAARLHHPALQPARARLERVGELAGATPAERLALVAVAHADALGLRCTAERAAKLTGRGLSGGALLGDEGPDSATPYRAASTLALADRFGDAADVSARGLEDARLRASALGVTLASVAAADTDLRRGCLADAEAHARTALDLTRESSLLAVFLPLVVSALLECAVERGELEGAERLLVRHCLGGALEAPGARERVLLARARVRLAQGRVEDAMADLRALGKAADSAGVVNPAALPWRSTLAPVLARRGQLEEARALAAEELELAERWGAPRALGIALRGAGEAQHGERSIALLERSVAVLEASPARLEHARALVSLGSALRREGRRSEARSILAQGVEAAERQGAPALAEHAAGELRVAGARPQRARLTGVGSLTASERRVVQIASDGATNREIAESLWLSVKTVEMHLHNAYRKLDVSSRRELTGALERDSAARP